MRAVVQRVERAAVIVDGRTVGCCGPGLLVLLGVHRDDEPSQARKMADRIAGMRVFPDADGRMNLTLASLPDDGLPRVLAIPNFTVHGDSSQRRPSFTGSAGFAKGRELFGLFVEELRALGVPTDTGEFGAHMHIELVADGPVTLVVDL
jgi:D-tyrosyl-tRNA(Tyr) deacylase